jgi:chitinase
MRSQGLLTSPTQAASPWIRKFDNVTQTPWLYNPTTKDFISYDDPTSIGIKTDWAVSQGLGGLFCWSLDQDNGELIDVMQKLNQGNTESKNGVYIPVIISIFSEKPSATKNSTVAKSKHSVSPAKKTS